MGEVVNNNDLSIYRGKRVLITGHTGFKGSWLALILNKIGANVTGFALPPDGDLNHFKMLNLDTQIQNVYGDIRDFDALITVFQDFRPEIVFHLAAQAFVHKSFDDPQNTFLTNVMGGVNLLQSVVETPSVRSLIFVTSDKCYENVEWIWGYRETDTLGGKDPYSASKAASELAFSSYLRSSFLNRDNFGAATARAGNVIGGGDFSEKRIVPDCVAALLAGEPIVLRNPKATRPWQHVLEPISGYLTLGQNLLCDGKKFSGAWNFGPPIDNAPTVENIVQSIIDSFGSGSFEFVDSTKLLHEAQLLQLNSDKARQLLGWKTKLNFKETVEKTVQWYSRVCVKGEEPSLVSLEQVGDFFRLKQ